MPLLEGNNFAVTLGSAVESNSGFVGYRKRLYAEITTAATSWTLYDEAGNASTIAGSSTDPTYITMATFRIETALTATTGDVLKLGISAADTGGYIVNTAAAASSLLAVQAVRLAVAPTAPVALTADLTLGLYLHNGSNTTPGGTLAAPTATPRVLVPVEVYYLKRATAIYSSQLNIRVADAKTRAGITW